MAGTLTLSTLSDGTNSTNATDVIRGSARAWVNFNGFGAIRASYNVSSVTQNGTGDYTINFTNAFVDVNYAVVSVGADVNQSSLGGIGLRTSTSPTTTSVRVGATAGDGTNFNNGQMHFAMFR